MKFFFENKDHKVRARYGNNLAYRAHLHNHIELVFMIEGRSKVIVESEEYIVNSGDVLLIFPDKIHQYLSIDKEYYVLCIFPQDLCPEFLNIFKYKVTESPLIKNAAGNNKIPSLFNNIVETVNNKTSFYDTQIKGYFLALLSELFSMTALINAKSTNSDTIKAILNYCAKNYNTDIRIENIAKELHINKYYVSHIFSKKLHTGYKDYISMLRISDACKLLKSKNISITEVAYSVGFNSPRSFNRLFLKCIGMTPRQYKSKDID